MIKAKCWIMSFVVAYGLALSSISASAATFPDKPVHFIVGFAPGGGTDTLSRLVGQRLSEKWGQPVIIENKPGSSGIIGMELTARAAPDGYSIGWVSNSLTTTPSMNKLSYDPINSFSPVTEVAYVPDILVVDPALGINSLKDLIALAKTKPGKLNFSTSGIGSAPFLEMNLVMQLTHTNFVHVPYSAGSTAVAGIMGGETQLKFSVMPSVMGQVKSGELKALAVSANVRSPVLPDVPTVAEALGIDHFEGANSDWTGVVVPAGTPREIVEQINRDIAEVIKRPDAQKDMANIGFVGVGSSPEDFSKLIATEIPRWAPLLKNATAK